MDVKGRLGEVQARMKAAAERAGRDPGEVRLIAVSKGFPPQVVSQIVEAGVTDFGENRVDELVSKAEQVTGAVWHFVGQLQTNKVKKVVGTASFVHSVDREALVDELQRRAVGASTDVRVLIEVNVSGEQSKAGVGPDDLEPLARRVVEADNLDLIGLMTMAPIGPAEGSRKVFRRLAVAADKLRDSLAYPGIRHLSMGMSQDYEVAIEEGATMVRVGEAIFGPRSRALKG